MSEVKSLQGTKVGTTDVDGSVFGERLHPVVLREAVLMYEANRRVGTHSTKTRSEVKGSTKKIYRQKHTGRARHGDRKANIFRGGGIAHGPKPRDYSYALPRKALKRAVQVALAGKFRDGEVLRWEGETIPGGKPSTRAAVAALDRLGVDGNALIVSNGPVDRTLLLSVRNLPRVRALPATEVSAYDLVRHNFLILLDGAYEALVDRLGLAATSEGSAE
ncbi:MAG: 50S ribosomal protein L4 [Planctomycetota bacterium]|jgi:large subunit ribosomal protein L4